MKPSSSISILTGLVAAGFATHATMAAETLNVPAKANIFRAGRGPVEPSPYQYGGGAPPTEFAFPTQPLRAAE